MQQASIHRIGIAGLGTVGAGLLSQIQSSESTNSIFSANNNNIILTGVSARNRNKDRGVPLDTTSWFDDPCDLAGSSDIDIFVELIGGDEGIARQSVERALLSGKHVVTANKALLAKHGLALAELAEKNNVALRYEAAVAGGIPIISAMREGASAMAITKIRGILNGTCNFILSQMELNGVGYEAALREAQELGFAEADPALDVGGFDAAHKLSILSAIAFGVFPKLEEIGVTGIEAISAEDIASAAQNGSRIRLLAESKMDENGATFSVAPVQVPMTSLFSAVTGANNHVQISGQPIGDLDFGGPGAGVGPTAGAVAGDILAIARGSRGPVFGRPANALSHMK